MRYLLLCPRQKDESGESTLIEWFRRQPAGGRIKNFYVRAGREIVAVVEAASPHDARDFLLCAAPAAIAGAQLLPLGGSGLQVIAISAAGI